MKRLCVRFVRAVNESGYFSPLEDDIPYQVLYDHLDHNVTGIVISPTLSEEAGINLCKEPKRLEDE